MNQTFSTNKIENCNPEILKLIENESEIIAKRYYIGLDSYFFLHIKEKPWYVSKVIYYWLIGRILKLSEFKLK